MNTFIELQEILQKCKSSESCFRIDKTNSSINCLDKNNLEECNLKCGVFTDLTWYLLKNNVDYFVTEDFHIQIKNKDI